MANSWSGGQYSLFRALLGIYLCVHFVHLLPWSAELFSREGVLPDARLSPIFALFPNLFTISDAPWFVYAVLGVSAAAALALVAGWHDRIAALWMLVVLASLFGRNPLIANPSLPYVGFMLLAHLFVPAAPYGSAAARGRVDPDGGWLLPRPVFLAAWVVLALSYSYSGYTKLLSPSWVAGDNIAFVLQNPLARPWILRDFFLWLPPIFLTLLTWIVLYVELLFAPIALLPRARPWIWLAMLLIQFGFLFLLNFADLTAGMLLFHLFTFDPAWIPAQAFKRSEVLYYDGSCAMCHGFVRFLLAEERTGTLRYAPLQGTHFQASVPESMRAGLPDSLILRTQDGTLHLRSAAVIQVMTELGGLWTAAAQLLRLVPRALRDGAYDVIGGLRYRVFGRAADACPVLTPQLRKRMVLLLVVAVFQFATVDAQACLYGRNVPPKGWYDWANTLFAGSVTKVEQDRANSVDTITVRVVETFKGTVGDVATVRIPNRLWATCKLEVPVVGASVLVALNQESDSALIPLTADYAEQLRAHRGRASPMAQAPAADPAKQLFEQYVALGRAFDPGVADLYADDAVIRNKRTYPTGEVREFALPAPSYKALLREAMPFARERGDRSTFSDVSYKAEGDRVRIRASRFSELKRYTSPISFLVGPSPSGKWLIYEELSESRP
jgi:predicted DCC family thiol-disulfide oxidoreductase YuxK